ncbi:hypothetical protein VNO77_36088 [Canavalia gladiata]|uniref:Uncharacterized protein n=1 Tax=Canavalia gladiata TaxID=3824 RepID=A0AAN9K8R8_CANGL
MSGKQGARKVEIFGFLESGRQVCGGQKWAVCGPYMGLGPISSEAPLYQREVPNRKFESVCGEHDQRFNMM